MKLKKESIEIHYLHFVEKMRILNARSVQRETNKDHVLSKVKYFIMQGWPSTVNEELEFYKRKKELLTVEQDVILWGHRIVIPEKLRGDILDELHQNHQGTNKMKSLARNYVWWPKIDRDIEEISFKCLTCIEVSAMPPKVKLHTWEWPQSQWQRLHADFLGPFKGQLILLIEDAYTKWIEAFTVPSTAAKYTIDKFKELFSRYGLCEYLVTDNGPPFNSEEFQNFLNYNGICHRSSSPYYPQGNGQAESGVKIIKSYLKKTELKNINRQLQEFLFDYRISTHSTTNTSPASLFFGRTIRTRFDLLRPNIRYTVNKKQTSMEKQIQERQTI